MEVTRNNAFKFSRRFAIQSDSWLLKAVAAMRGADQHIRRSLGFSILSKGTLTCRPGESNQRPSESQQPSKVSPASSQIQTSDLRISAVYASTVLCSTNSAIKGSWWIHFKCWAKCSFKQCTYVWNQSTFAAASQNWKLLPIFSWAFPVPDLEPRQLPRFLLHDGPISCRFLPEPNWFMQRVISFTEKRLFCCYPPHHFCIFTSWPAAYSSTAKTEFAIPHHRLYSAGDTYFLNINWQLTKTW